MLSVHMKHPIFPCPPRGNTNSSFTHKWKCPHFLWPFFLLHLPTPVNAILLKQAFLSLWNFGGIVAFLITKHTSFMISKEPLYFPVVRVCDQYVWTQLPKWSLGPYWTCSCERRLLWCLVMEDGGIFISSRPAILQWNSWKPLKSTRGCKREGKQKVP